MSPAQVEYLLGQWAALVPTGVWAALAAVAGVGLLVAVTAATIRAEASRPRDPQRLFDAEQKALMRARCGNQCEHNGWIGGRCQGSADQADHIHPWSRGGATSIANGQYLCAGHNNAKSNWRPTTFYVWRLTHRRRAYFPAGHELRVWKYYGTPPPWSC